MEKKSDQNDGVVITPDCVKFPEFVPNPITLSTDEVIVYIDDEMRPHGGRK